MEALLDAMLEIATAGLSPQLLAALKHAASFHNPEFYRRQKMRRSTWGVPRLVCCFDSTDPDWLKVPRGLADEAVELIARRGSPRPRRQPRYGPGPANTAWTCPREASSVPRSGQRGARPTRSRTHQDKDVGLAAAADGHRLRTDCRSWLLASKLTLTRTGLRIFLSRGGVPAADEGRLARTGKS